jgi:hypothetical protein
MGELQRYIVRTNEIGVSAGFESSHGPWVSHQDHAKEIATLRAEVERWVKEVAHLKLAAEKAERISNEPSR